MYRIEEKNCNNFGTFRRPLVHRLPGYFAPLALLVIPLVLHFDTKCTAVKFAEPWMSNHLSELRYHSYVSSARYPECPTKDWRDKSCWLNPRENDPEVFQGRGGVTASPTLFGPTLVGIRRATREGTFGAFAPPKFSKHCIAILTFEENFK